MDVDLLIEKGENWVAIINKGVIKKSYDLVMIENMELWSEFRRIRFYDSAVATSSKDIRHMIWCLFAAKNHLQHYYSKDRASYNFCNVFTTATFPAVQRAPTWIIFVSSDAWG